MVLHEEHKSNSNNRSKSKKVKKIPQRGLGVAQLEKLRIEEQQKNNSSASASTSSSSSNPFTIILPSTPPKQAPLAFMSTDPNSFPFHGSSLPLNTTSKTIHLIDPTEAEMGTSSFPFHGSSIPLNTTSKGIHLIDPTEAETGSFTFHFGALPNNSSTHDPQINQHQIRSQYNQPKSTVTLVNKTMLPLSSGVNLQIEPPSNQICNSYIRPSWIEEERTVSMNPSWPITMPDFTSFPRRNLPILTSFRTVDEHSNEAMKFESRNRGFREDGSSSIAHQVDWKNSDMHINKRLRESNLLVENSSLSLGSSLVQSISKSNPQHCEYPEVNFLQSHFTQGSANREILRSEEATQQPFYNFFPSAPSTTCEAASKDEGNIRLDGVDTNLRL